MEEAFESKSANSFSKRSQAYVESYSQLLHVKHWHRRTKWILAMTFLRRYLLLQTARGMVVHVNCTSIGSVTESRIAKQDGLLTIKKYEFLVLFEPGRKGTRTGRVAIFEFASYFAKLNLRLSHDLTRLL